MIRKGVLSAEPYTRIDTLLQYLPITNVPVSTLIRSLLLVLESGVGKLEGKTSHYQAFIVAWLLIPALLNLAHLHPPIAIASFC